MRRRTPAFLATASGFSTPLLTPSAAPGRISVGGQGHGGRRSDDAGDDIRIGDGRQFVDRAHVEAVGDDRDQYAVVGDRRPARLQRFQRCVRLNLNTLDHSGIEMLQHPGPHAWIGWDRPQLLETCDRHMRSRREIQHQARIGS
jgi:hypothetical protein